MKHALFSLLILSGAVVGTTAAIEVPQPKPGWWEMHSTIDGKPGPAARVCTTASETARRNQARAQYTAKNCIKNETHHEGDQWITDAVCKVGDSTSSVHSVTVFDGDNAYHTENTTTVNPPYNGVSNRVTTGDSKWLGACKLGQTTEVLK